MWTKVITADGSVFYYNSSNNKSVWKPPADAIVHEAPNLKAVEAADPEQLKNIEAMNEFSIGIEKEKMQSSDQVGNDALPTGSVSLPPNWMQAFDQITGRQYYVNPTTGQSQWEQPTAVAGDFESILPTESSSSSNQGETVSVDASSSLQTSRYLLRNDINFVDLMTPFYYFKFTYFARRFCSSNRSSCFK